MAFNHPDLMPQMLATRAVDNPNGVALKKNDGSVLTWETAYQDSLRVASALERIGVLRGQPVITIFNNGLEAYCSWLGCAWLGAIEAPINTAYKGEWLRHAIDNTAAEVVLTDARFVAPLLEIADQLPHLKHVVVYGEWAMPAQQAACNLLTVEEFLEGADAAERPEPGPWDVSSLIYTSGTTGRSKAVMVPWAHLKSSLESGFIPHERLPGIRVYAPYPVFHITGKGAFYFATVFGGASVIRETFSSTDYWDDVRTFDANATVLLGPLAQMLLDQPEKENDRDNPMQTICMAPVIPGVDEFCERFGVDVFTTYNMTEINCPIIRADECCTSENYRSCGKARPGVEVRIVDDHDLEVPPNTPGELIVRGEPWELNAGYWNMPEQTNEAWRNGWFHTGDAFTYDEQGNHYFVDRVKDYIRRRGENISSFEIEAIVNAHPDVAECGAVAVPSEHGEDEVKIAVVVEPGADFEPADLINYLVPRMPRFAIPRYVEIWESLPKTEATARIQKTKIRAMGVGDQVWDRVEAGVEIPRN
jgi:crotonobetaine/carnitine-CoA ligase